VIIMTENFKNVHIIINHTTKPNDICEFLFFSPTITNVLKKIYKPIVKKYRWLKRDVSLE